MSKVNVMVMRAAGTNCDIEAVHAWQRAGASVERVHLRRVIEQPRLLDRFQILTLPGGFSYGDDIAAGKIFAVQLRRHLDDHLRKFVDAGKLILGICNGFQILVKAGLLPDRDCERPICTVTYNDPPGFQDRWVTLRAGQSPCVFTEPGRTYEMPIAHGEGRVLFDSPDRAAVLHASGQMALLYTESPADTRGHGPHNPNGSTADIGGLCDPTGRVLGLMPHPERFIEPTHHPCWTSRPKCEQGDGLAIFQRGVAYFG